MLSTSGSLFKIMTGVVHETILEAEDLTWVAMCKVSSFSTVFYLQLLAFILRRK